MGCNPSDTDFTSIKFDEEQHVEGHQTAQGPDLGAEEVRGPQHVHMAADEVSPCRSCFLVERIWNAPALEDISHGLITDDITQIS
jgi:hypothetical protein